MLKWNVFFGHKWNVLMVKKKTYTYMVYMERKICHQKNLHVKKINNKTIGD